MVFGERDDEKYEKCEQTIEELLDIVNYEDIEEDVLKDMYLDIQTRYNLVQDWKEDDGVDWVVVDDFLENTTEMAANFCEAYNP